ncbi:tRNA (N(6)-L-threonylcarbamoyladenosine(37)-C(2))-methylthiotransferase MtaB [bacterium]|nr:tRNA (N(6)-L-threonylcarbamoyladenosine(37)-C(2))-methylthiotransferase MtaB [bacterium]
MAQNTKKTLKTYTFGCKVNWFDSAQVESAVSQFKNWNIDAKSKNPDAVVINTCTVTESADKQARQLIRKVHRDTPNAKIIVTGCYAEADADRISQMPGVSDVVAIKDRPKINESLGLPSLTENDAFKTLAQTSQRTRAYLKMQDGCNAYCAFCVLPYVRGRSRSIDIKTLVELAQSYEQHGYKEMIITGTHVGSYGRDLKPRMTFAKALDQILKETHTIRLKVSSLEPTTLTPEFIKVVGENSRIVPHFHIPMQSGSDDVLRRMNRKNKAQNFNERIMALSKTQDNVCIGTDVIVGFCGETEQDFMQSYEALKNLPISYFHVFPYSGRPGTRAEKVFTDDVDPQVKKHRVKLLRDLSFLKQTEFYQRFEHTTEKILVEKKRDKEGYLQGQTTRYVRVKIKGHDRLQEKEVEVQLSQLDNKNTENIVFYADVL